MSRRSLIQFRRDSAAIWTSRAPVLAEGELGFETDTGKFKIGDGASAWAALDYFDPGAGGSVSLFTSSTDGTVPASGGGSTNFLRADGTWAAPAGSGGTTSNALTFNSSGGASPGVTFNGSAARTVDYSTVGAAKTGAITGSGLTMGTGVVLYRKTASSGAIEEQTLATLKTDLGLTGTNSGDQTITLTGDVTGSGTGSFAATIGNDAVTYAKMQNVSATDRLLGRSTAGSGDVEEIVCTAAGRALIDDADAAAQRATLGLAAIAASGSGADLAGASVTFAKVQNVAASRLLGNPTGGAATVSEIALGANLAFSGSTIVVSAAGSDRQIQFNSSGSLAGASALDVDADGNLRVDHAASVTTPGADQLTLAPQRVNASGGRVTPRWRTEDGITMSMAAHQGRNCIVWAQAQGNSANELAPVGFSSGMTGLGTLTARNVATTNRLTRAKRLGRVSAATAGSQAGWHNSGSGHNQWTVGGASGGGFDAIFVFGVSDASLVSGAHQFVGLRNATAAPTATTNPSTLTNVIGLAQLNGSANWHIVYGGSAAQTAVDTGIAVDLTGLLELRLFARPDVNNKVSWRLENITSGSVASGELTGTAGTALPANTTFLGPAFYRSNNATAAAVGLDMARWYIESDF